MHLFSWVTLLATALIVRSVAADVDPIVIKGSKFFYKTNGTQFYIRGVAYQQDYTGNGSYSTSNGAAYIDPLADGSTCQRDIPYLIQLRTNVIRVYALDPTKNHDACMNALADAGIYVIADLGAPGTSINRNDPNWNEALFARYVQVIDNMQQYTNTLGFFAGNEVTNAINNTDASAFVKAAVRDSKAYIREKNYRPIGVGYAENDDAEIRVNMADYFNCGDAADAIDFWGYNIYSWCGDSSYTISGYNERTAEFSTYSVPAFFAEYGCNTVQPREFTDVPVLFGPQMSPVWSGGIIYMYFQEVNDYGLVSIGPNSQVTTLAEFNAYSTQIAKANPTGTNMNAYTPTNRPAACPAVNADWGAASNLPPTPNAELCTCMYNALTCVPNMNKVTDDNIGSLFGLVCGLGTDPCAGIFANATEGQYGAYVMCDSQQQLGWALNEYYLEQVAAGNGDTACDFSGSATTQHAVKPTGTCLALLEQAGRNGTGTVTSAPTGPGAISTGSTSKGVGAPGAGTVASVQIGVVHVALYLLTAVCAGAGMVLL